MLNITFCSFPDYSGNARCLYEYMKKKYDQKMNLTWVIKDEKLFKKLKEEKISVVLDESKQMNELMNNTDVFFTTHANLTAYKKQNSNTLYVELWHGVSPKCIGYLINDLNDTESSWLKEIVKKIDYFIVPSKFWVPIFAARFHTLPKKILPLGFPLFDNIIKADGKKNLNKILGIDTSKYQKIIYYMPTVRMSKSREEKVDINTANVFNVPKYNEKKLLEYLENNQYLLCIKHHPSEQTKFKKVKSDYIKYIDEEMLKKHELDTNTILNASDILISDYSSVGLHYLMLEKPVIYLSSDIEELNNTRGILFGNFKFWTGENIATSINSILERLDTNLKNKNEKELKEKKELLFGSLKDGGCKEICDYFFKSDGTLKNVEYTYSKEEQLQKENIVIKQELNDIKNSKGYQKLEQLRKINSKIKRIFHK